MNRITSKKLQLSSYIDSPHQYDFFLNTIYATLCQLEAEYPQFHSWYYEKVAQEIKTKKREILFTISTDHYISGIVILKNHKSEKKICTIRVPEKYQKNGLGKALIINAMDILNTEKPLITVSSKKHAQFKRLFSYFAYTKTEEKQGFYFCDATENIYNGTLI